MEGQVWRSSRVVWMVFVLGVRLMWNCSVLVWLCAKKLVRKHAEIGSYLAWHGDGLLLGDLIPGSSIFPTSHLVDFQAQIITAGPAELMTTNIYYYHHYIYSNKMSIYMTSPDSFIISPAITPCSSRVGLNRQHPVRPWAVGNYAKCTWSC